MGQFEIVVVQLIGFFMMLTVGYGCVRLRLYGVTTLNGMCALLLKVLIPVMVFANAVSGTTRDQLMHGFPILLLGVITYALLITTFWIVAKLLRLRHERGRIFQAAMIFGNAGFIGIPLVMALFPKNGAIYVALLAMVDQVLLWTYGVWLCEPEDTSRQRTGIGNRIITLLKNFVNPAVISVLLAVAIILAGLRVPAGVLQPLHTIGNMATPMSMIYLGGLLAMTRWWVILKRYELYAGMIIKMLLFPLGLEALLSALPLNFTHEMILMITIIAALPTMTTITMFCGDKHNMPEYAVGFVLATTLFSMFSLAVVSAVIL